MKNKNGIDINECCASCRHKDLTRLISSRFCLMNNRSVKPRGWCEKWTMSEQMEAVGSGRGKVKKQSYLKYVLEVRSDESLADQLGLSQLPHKTLEEIRKDFEEKNGSIFWSL